MYRILVIDDEPIIADGLYELFAQDETFALEVHKVYSAPDALKLLDRLRIDIVLSDIKMPGMNGLELLTQIHRRWPFCHVIFLSGYSDFEYVQKAMQLGADSYILKSQGDEVVLETVYKTLALLEQETTSAVWNRRMEEELKNARPLLCQDFLWKMLRGEITGAQLEQQLLKLGLPLRAGHPVFLVGGRLDHMPQKSDVADSAQLLEQIHAVFMTYTLPTLNCANVCWQNRYWLWLIQPLEQNPAVVARLDSFLSGMLERVQEYCQKQLCVAVSLVTDSQPHAWQELPAAFERYRSVLTYQLGAQDEMLLGEIAFLTKPCPTTPFGTEAPTRCFPVWKAPSNTARKTRSISCYKRCCRGFWPAATPFKKLSCTTGCVYSFWNGWLPRGDRRISLTDSTAMPLSPCRMNSGIALFPPCFPKWAIGFLRALKIGMRRAFIRWCTRCTSTLPST